MAQTLMRDIIKAVLYWGILLLGHNEKTRKESNTKDRTIMNILIAFRCFLFFFSLSFILFIFMAVFIIGYSPFSVIIRVIFFINIQAVISYHSSFSSYCVQGNHSSSSIFYIKIFLIYSNLISTTTTTYNKIMKWQWYQLQLVALEWSPKPGKINWGADVERKHQGHPDDIIITISKNTFNIPRDLRKLALTQTTMKTHPLKLTFKARMEK